MLLYQRHSCHKIKNSFLSASSFKEMRPGLIKFRPNDTQVRRPFHASWTSQLVRIDPINYFVAYLNGVPIDLDKKPNFIINVHKNSWKRLPNAPPPGQFLKQRLACARRFAIHAPCNYMPQCHQHYHRFLCCIRQAKSWGVSVICRKIKHPLPLKETRFLHLEFLPELQILYIFRSTN